MAHWLQAEVLENHRWTEGLYSLRFSAPLPAFKAGQFVRVGLDIDGERVGRPYSLVNAPGRQPAEIYYNPVPGGPLSPRLAALQPGDMLWVSDSINGFLVLDEVPDAHHLWLLATGTGLGPFISILATEEPWRRFEQVVLVHSVRTAAQLGYRQRLAELTARHPGRFHYVPTVTREACADALGQRIPALLADGSLEAAAGIALTPDDAHVMLCGSNAMISDTHTLLEQRGLRRHRRRQPGHITVEKYH
jgi:ferredoxin--NADP+ reductase